jgi:Haem-binding domain
MKRRILIGIVIAVVVLFAVIQLIPYGHNNPPVIQEPAWDNPQTRDPAVRSCYDCHSNQTVWPWYANIAPISWALQIDVDEARQQLNFSEWNRPQPGAAKAVDDVQSGRMPSKSYVSSHPLANLTPEEKAALVQGLKATLGQQ